jgi:hypothetical protein
MTGICAILIERKKEGRVGETRAAFSYRCLDLLVRKSAAD